MRIYAKGKRQESILVSARRKSENFGFVDLDNPEEIKKTSAMRFLEYKDQFIKLTKRKKISENFNRPLNYLNQYHK